MLRSIIRIWIRNFWGTCRKSIGEHQSVGRLRQVLSPSRRRSWFVQSVSHVQRQPVTCNLARAKRSELARLRSKLNFLSTPITITKYFLIYLSECVKSTFRYLRNHAFELVALLGALGGGFWFLYNSEGPHRQVSPPRLAQMEPVEARKWVAMFIHARQIIDIIISRINFSVVWILDGVRPGVLNRIRNRITYFCAVSRTVYCESYLNCLSMW